MHLLGGVAKIRCSIRPAGSFARPALRDPPAARIEEACRLLGRSSAVLSITPETGYEEPVADRESVGSGGTMAGESPRLGALRAYGGYSWT
jgi:hypothetical protein